jgi:transposase
MEYIHKEMSKKGVTLSLLWEEYCANCKASGEIPFGYTQYCYHYRQYANITKATMHISHKPGEQLEVDWAGQTASIIDKVTGEVIPSYVFVAVLASSGYAYVEAFLSQEQESWITAHTHTFRHFDGVTRIIVPDNLKTGVEKANWYSPTINKSYHEMAEHYGCAVVPARVRKPKDKPSVEGAVGVISTWVIAALRQQKYFTLGELNADILKKLKDFNEKPFQKKEGSRLSVFLTEEKEMLLPLPTTSYELAIWKTATVQFNYHVNVDKMWYSVPYEYIKQIVDIRLTGSVVEMFYNNHRVCSHPRLRGKEGQYNTIPEHMPEKHKSYTEWNSERFTSWASAIGENTKAVITSILNYHKVEQQGYRACMGLLKSGDRYGVKRLESACAKALSYTPNPSYKNVDSILKSGQDKTQPPKEEKESPTDESFGFTRGADYYGGTKKC